MSLLTYLPCIGCCCCGSADGDSIIQTNKNVLVLILHSKWVEIVVSLAVLARFNDDPWQWLTVLYFFFYCFWPPSILRWCCCGCTDGDSTFGRCEPVHRGPGSASGYNVRLLADGLGAEVIADCDADHRVWAGSGQMSPVLAGAVRRRYAVWTVHRHSREGRHHSAVRVSWLCPGTLPLVFRVPVKLVNWLTHLFVLELSVWLNFSRGHPLF